MINNPSLQGRGGKKYVRNETACGACKRTTWWRFRRRGGGKKNPKHSSRKRTAVSSTNWQVLTMARFFFPLNSSQSAFKLRCPQEKRHLYAFHKHFAILFRFCFFFSDKCILDEHVWFHYVLYWVERYPSRPPPIPRPSSPQARFSLMTLLCWRKYAGDNNTAVFCE